MWSVLYQVWSETIRCGVRDYQMWSETIRCGVRDYQVWSETQVWSERLSGVE